MIAKTKQASFDCSKADRHYIGQIVDRALRAARQAGIDYEMIDCRMDITACHCSGTPLKLAALLAADDFNFAHDIFGIRRHIDRESGQLKDCFVPRFAK